MNYKLFLPYSLCLLLIVSCCKPPETEMNSTFIPNTYTGLDSLYTRMAANDTVTIVCYGNSITYGGGITYPQTFQNLLQLEYNNPNITVINEGHPGWTAEMAAGGMDSLVLPHQPDLVTIIFGINDIYHDKDTVNYKHNLGMMANTLIQLGIPVLIMSPTPLNNQANYVLTTYCTAANEVATEYNVAFFNMHFAMVERIYAETDKAETIMPDEIHYTNFGYQLIGEELMKYWQAR